MRLRLKEDPKEWRKRAALGAFGPAVILVVLSWRGVISNTSFLALLAVMALAVLCAWIRPGLFRGYYRFTTRLGFYATQFVGKAVLALLFFVVITPFGLLLRGMGKDLLQLKSSRDKTSFWRPAKKDSSLDSMF